ncbi:metallophosphoesterase [uncultured Ferrimonas sp.]|uniref:metallophosphoesterase n=1 Tax=uncultured Ferrimonas sp. TaxID=432640 RepID=UPI00261D2D2C|nr:metallophosphoesterase [uncultured Ferrimonas sp.]
MSKKIIKTHQCNGTAFFVGDIHGEYHQLMRSLAHVGFNADNGDQLYSVGDLIDRGEHSLRCLELLEKPWFHAVRGNHEAMMLAALSGDVQSRELWFSAGGGWFQALSNTEQQQIAERFQPQLNDLPIAMEITIPSEKLTMAMIHADFPFDDWQQFSENSANLDEHQLAKCLWSRSTLRGLDRGKYPAPIAGIDALVMGHTPLPMFRGHGNRVWLDTGAGYPNGSLTVLSAHQIVHMLLR